MAELRPPAEVAFSDYLLGGFLQQGGWGTVHAATRRRDGKRVAMKFFGYTEREPSLRDISNEIDLMMKLAGLSGVVQLEGVFSDSETGLVPNKNPRFLRAYPVIVMELIEGGELYSRIANRTSVTERYLATMFRSTVEGLRGIHGRGYVHRDLKLDNVLLLSVEEQTLAKIIDFGLMIRLPAGQDRVEIRSSSLCGTNGYFAPESILRHEYSYKTDIWQLGCILYSMLCGQPAFHPDARYQRQITNMTYYPMTGASWEGISAEAKDLVARILTKSPEARCSIDDILAHPWCTGAAPAEELGPDYIKRVKALALRQKLKRFFIDNDIEHEHRVRRRRLEIIEDAGAGAYPGGSGGDYSGSTGKGAASCAAAPTIDKIKHLKRALVQVISMQANAAYSAGSVSSHRDDDASPVPASLSSSKLAKGEIEVGDFCEIMLSLDLRHLASPEVFGIFDINQDGKIDMKEFLLTLLSFRVSAMGSGASESGDASLHRPLPHRRRRREEEAEEEDAATLYFHFFDLDEDGYISRAELRAVIMCLFHDGGPLSLSSELPPTDSNSDVSGRSSSSRRSNSSAMGGSLSAVNVEDLFDLIDNNPKDGRIDIEEFKVFYYTILLPSATVRSVHGGGGPGAAGGRATSSSSLTCSASLHVPPAAMAVVAATGAASGLR